MRGSTSCSPFRCQVAPNRVSLSLIFCQCHLITQYTLDPGLVNLYFYTLREPNNYIKRTSPFFSSFSVVRLTHFFGIITKKKKKSHPPPKVRDMTTSNNSPANIFGRKFFANCSEVNSKGYPEFESPISARFQRHPLF